ncbi:MULTISPECIES: ATP-dependent nuclease [Enterobacterales]|uniref:ATP-dependent nuclease n=1 Tax=Enterobacterales TaxID=91347 RepID=UPI000CFB9B44|nr:MULTISPECIES: ATP-binding protein [Enterobacteriaceae]ELY4308213.1 AAA family ATPase [Cronobacter sakazakii]MDL5345518.1 AAA family ATPase [Enterobacter hormaechei]SXD11745.1 recombination protein F [Klebsiella quasipneumoniae]HCK7231061.1 AAA family ATPase [Enterobacter hormaechei]HCK7294595.1 AAA family ATPase [Enterobacter hormaechei]
MPKIRHIEVENFRVIKKLSWSPSPGLNCLIGPGDSGKSTILDAIDLALGARRSYTFNDADFYGLDVTKKITISITIGMLNDELLNFERYGPFLRSFNSETCEIHDEPHLDYEPVLTLKLVVESDLEPDWRLYSLRADVDGVERRLPWKHREMISPSRLGVTPYNNLAWGSRSVLNKLSEERFDVTSVLTQLSRQTRNAFAANPIEGLDKVLEDVKSIGNKLGVPLGELKALLDVNGITLSNGAISLHGSDGTPLRQLGTGSSRLLISGIQKATSQSTMLLVDEAEYGLEPYRISRLLNELGAKEENPLQQVFLTTHSPYVLRELQSKQLHVIRKKPPLHQADGISHNILSLGGGDDQQATLRACAEAFFSKKVIVGEGATEVGIIRGLELYCQDINHEGFLSKGVFCTDGNGGSNYFVRAEIFSSLGYPTAILKDSDIQDAAHAGQTAQCIAKGVRIYEWGHGLSTEGAIFYWCDITLIPKLINLAIELNGRQEVAQHIENKSANQFKLENCLNQPEERMRMALYQAAGSYKWFKNIAKSEELSRKYIGPNFKTFKNEFQIVLNGIYQWACEEGHQQ